MEKSHYNFVDPTKQEKLPQWRIELEARIFLEENNINYPDITHVPFSITAEAVLPEGYEPHESQIHFVVPHSTPLRTQRLMFYNQVW